MKEKRYAVVEVGEDKCPCLSLAVHHDGNLKNMHLEMVCRISGEENPDCENCTKGQTLPEMVEKMEEAHNAWLVDTRIKPTGPNPCLDP